MYSLESMLHHFHLSGRRRPSGFEALAINYTISQVASGMLAMFGVLFVYELGEKFNKGILMVLLFFGLQRVVVGLAVPLVAKFISRTGYRWMMFIGLSALAIKAWFLMQVSEYSLWLLIPALILGGVAIASYYQGYHGIFLDDNDDDRIGEQIGLLTLFGRMALIVSPILAGFLVDSYGYSVMFGVAMSLLIVSLTPLFLMDHHEHKPQKFVTKKLLSLIKKKDKNTRAIFWWYVENAIQTFYWPVFLFLVVGSHIRFGIIASLVMVVNSAATYMAGKTYDKRPLRRAFPLAGFLVATTDVLRYMSHTMFLAAGVDSINRIASPFWWMKIRRSALVAGEKVKAVVFAAVWEWIVTGGYMVGLLMGYMVLKISGGDWIWLGVPSVIGVLMATLAKK